jgi:hypothetical protein
MAGERPVIPAADFLRDSFSGIADGISDLSDSMSQNDALDRILPRYLESRSMNINGLSVRHYDRSGSLEYKLKAHSVEQGLADDVLYYSKRDELIQWATENRPELLPVPRMASASIPTPPKTSAPAEELIEGMYGPIPPKVKSSSTALADLEQEWNRARRLKPRLGEAPISDIAVFMQRAQESSLAATDVTRKSIEDHGYLYHYAPRQHRESILSEGLMTSKARTAAADAALPGISKGAIPSGGMYFFTNPEDAPSAVHVVSGGVQGLDKQGADLYRVKIEPGMLDDMVVDWKLPIRPDAASAVIATNKSGAFKPELIGEDAKFGRRDVEYKPVVSAPPADSVAKTSATKVIPIADEYDTGATAAKVASGEPIVAPPPVTSTTVPPVSAPPKTAPSTSKGPKVGAPTSAKKTPGPHGVAIAPPTVPPPAPPGPSAPPGPPTTSPTGPTAKIVNNVQGNNLTAREAIRGISQDIKAVRKPGQRLMSAQGSKSMAEAVTQGIKGSRNLKMLAVGSALGLGGYTANRLAGRGDTSDLGG